MYTKTSSMLKRASLKTNINMINSKFEILILKLFSGIVREPGFAIQGSLVRPCGEALFPCESDDHLSLIADSEVMYYLVVGHLPRYWWFLHGSPLGGPRWYIKYKDPWFLMSLKILLFWTFHASWRIFGRFLVDFANGFSCCMNNFTPDFSSISGICGYCHIWSDLMRFPPTKKNNRTLWLINKWFCTDEIQCQSGFSHITLFFREINFWWY